MKLPYIRCVHALLCVLLCLHLFSSVQDVTAFKAKKVIYGLALAHFLGLLKDNHLGGGGGGGHNVHAHPMPIYPMPMPRKCKKDYHIHEHIDMHSYEDHDGGGYGMGGDDHYDLGDHDLGGGHSSYGKHSPTYLDDDDGLGSVGGGGRGFSSKSSSKYMMDDASEDAGSAEYDEGGGGGGPEGAELSNDDPDGYDMDDSSRMMPSTSKALLGTSPGALKKYFKKWSNKRKRPRKISVTSDMTNLMSTTERNSYEDDAQMDSPTTKQHSTKYELQNAEQEESSAETDGGEDAASSKESSTTLEPEQVGQASKLQTQKSVSTRKSTKKSSIKKSTTPKPSDQSESSENLQNDSLEPIQPLTTVEPTMEEVMKKKLHKKKKQLKTYFQKIKIGQYFKPYMLMTNGATSDNSKKVSGTKKDAPLRKLKKLKFLSSKEVLDTPKDYGMPKNNIDPQASPPFQVPINNPPQVMTHPQHPQNIKGFYSMGPMPPALQPPSGPLPPNHQMIPQTSMMLAMQPQQQIQIAPNYNQNSAITIMEQPGGAVAAVPGYMGYPQNAPQQTIYIDPNTGSQYMGPSQGGPPGHEIVAEQIIVHQDPSLIPTNQQQQQMNSGTKKRR